MNKILLSGITFLALSTSLFSGEIKQTISIYGWLPSLDGNIKYSLPISGGGSEETESGLGDTLEMVLMGGYELRKDKYSFMLDAMYLKLSDEQSKEFSFLDNKVNINLGAKEEVETFLLSAYGGYNIIDSESFKMDAIAGLRYLNFGVKLDFSLNNFNTGIDKSVDVYDGVIGVRGEYNINENWFLPYLVDVGAGDSELTWQASASVGYRFDWGDALLTYRYLHYTEDAFIQEFDLYGPKIGLNFHF